MKVTLGFLLSIVFLNGIPCGWTRGEERENDDFTFFVIGDPQVNLVKWGTAGTEATLDIMNRLPGQPFPGGGVVEKPRALLVLGDLVDDIRNPADWQRYRELFDVHGQGVLRYKVYELLGNHDLGGEPADDGFSPHQQEFLERNKSRRDSLHYDSRSYHYSWDWGNVHFVGLSVFPGNEPRPVYDRVAPWNDPKRSLDFLRTDLAGRVGGSGRPVVLCWHYGLEGWGLEKWWAVQDLENLKQVIQPYNVVLILHGHEHAYKRYQWQGYDVMMAPAPQVDPVESEGRKEGRPKGFLVVRFQDDRMDVAHWSAGAWREQWGKSLVQPGESVPQTQESHE
ncbi:MAG: metallophosphoesterase [Solirubrobacterales bacterium]